MIKNVVGYCRVSTQDQAREGASLQTQEKIIRDYAAQLGWSIEKMFVEAGESAKTADRTELQEMIQYCGSNKGKIDAIVVYKIDRFTRNSNDYHALSALFAALKVQVISATEHTDDTPMGRFIGGIMAGVAQYDNDVRAERTRGGMETSVRNGRFVWKAPTGYVNGLVEDRKNILPQEPQAAHIARGFQLIENGYTPVEALRVLEKDDFVQHNGRRVSLTLWSKILCNPIYAGRIRAFGELFEGRFKAIVDWELFRRVQEALQNRNKRLPKYQQQRADFPLRGLIKCNCGKRFTASWSRGRHGKRYPYYRCTKCKGANYKLKDIERNFSHFLEGSCMDEGLAFLLRIAIEENAKMSYSNVERARGEATKKIEALQADQAAIMKKNIAGICSDDLARRLTEGAEKEIEMLKGSLSALPTVSEEIKDVVDFGLNVMRDIRTTWETLPLLHKQRFQSFLFPEGVNFSAGEFGTPRTALILEIKTTFHDGRLSLVTPRGVEPRLQA